MILEIHIKVKMKNIDLLLKILMKNLVNQIVQKKMIQSNKINKLISLKIFNLITKKLKNQINKNR